MNRKKQIKKNTKQNWQRLFWKKNHVGKHYSNS
jgi:hypothetical protein